jgi:hypothetical protein
MSKNSDVYSVVDEGETSVCNYPLTLRHMPEERNPVPYRCENPKTGALRLRYSD